MYFDCHNHSQFSFDGERTTAEKSVVSALEKGLGGICFTDHCDFYVPPMKADFEPLQKEEFDVRAQQEELDRLADRVAEGTLVKSASKKFRVLKGVEIGVQESCRAQIRDYFRTWQFDQVIASLHYIDDADPYWGDRYYRGKTWKEAYGHYLDVLFKELRFLGDDFDIMGHFDYVARYAPYPVESFLYRDFPAHFDEILRYLAENGKALEINTKTYQRYGFRTPQLDRNILLRFLELGGELITLGSDSHNPERVGDKFQYYGQYVKSLGFRRLAYFERRKPRLVTI